MPTEKKDIISQYPKDLPFKYNKKLSFVKNKKDRLKIEKKIKASGYSKIQYVGNSYKKLKTNNRNSTITVSPHWRRGYWRNQPYGKGLKNKKLVWIEPVIVNYKIGKPNKGHIYEIKN